MKKAMRYTAFFRALILLLAMSLLLGAMALPAGAFDVDAEETEYVTWTHDVYLKGYDPMTGETRSYSKILNVSSRIHFMPMSYYHYANEAVMVEEAYSVTGNARNGDFLILDDGTLMATKEGKDFLSALPAYKRGFSEYRLLDGTLMTSMDEETYESIRTLAGEGKQSCTLFSLRSTTCYPIWGFCEDGWFGVPVAFLFEMEDGLYFASALYLDDDCFTDEGELQPKSGVTLDLYPLGEEATDLAYEQIRRIGYKSPINTYEAGSFMIDLYDGTYSAAATYVSVVILGIVLPAAPIAVGLCLPRSGRGKRWYFLAMLGGAWLVMGILTLVLTILAG